jgi:hypothetical protein
VTRPLAGSDAVIRGRRRKPVVSIRAATPALAVPPPARTANTAAVAEVRFVPEEATIPAVQPAAAEGNPLSL